MSKTPAQKAADKAKLAGAAEAPADATTAAPAEAASEKPAKAGKPRAVRADKLTVTLPDGTQRVYSQATHGAVWETLAKNYAESNDGEIE